MPKSTISFRVEAKLLAQFCNAALKQNRVPIDVLIEFIANYVSNERNRRLVTAVDSSTERQASLGSQRTLK